MMAKEKPDEQDKLKRPLKEVTTNGHIPKEPKPSPRWSKTDKGFVIKFKFPNFEKNPIYSVDVYPDGTRFAAGGMGEDSGRIVVWHINVVKADRPDVRMICQMDHHGSCVNSVRWSHKGKYLASASDDKLVMIWHQTHLKDSENWQRAHVLTRHTGDVFGLNWSPNDAMLASCSVDNDIIIWNALSSFEPITTLKGHTALVKGVTWDPIGKYLASQADDKTLRIWRVDGWKEQHVVRGPFEECYGSTQLLRLDWSTDGMNIISAHAANEGRPVAQIIDREGQGQGGWKCEKYFAGHSRPVVCVRFSSRMYVASNEQSTPYCVCATGGRDHTVCIWSFHHRRPHVFPGLFTSPVMDLAWFPDGYSLLACSMDGTIAYIYCGRALTGVAITKDQQTQSLTKLYGKTVVEGAANSVGSHNIVESSVFLDAQEAESSRRKDAGDRTTSSRDAPVPLPYEGIPLLTQKESWKNGKRHIIPVFIPETAYASQPSVNVFATDERSQSNSALGDATKGPEESPQPPDPAVQMGRPECPSALRAVISRKVPSPVKDGTPSGRPQPSMPAPSRKPLVDPIGNGAAPRAQAPPKQKARLPAKVNGSQNQKEVEIVGHTKSQQILDGLLQLQSDAAKGKSAHPQHSTPRRSVPTTPRRVLSAPSPVSRLNINIEESNSATGSNPKTLTVENDLEPAMPGGIRFHKIHYLAESRVNWAQYLLSPVTLAKANENITCVICDDLSMRIYSSQCGMLLRQQSLTAPGTELACSANSVVVVTADCQVQFWTRAHVSSVWSRRSLGSIEWLLKATAGPVNILQLAITTTEVPVIGLSDHRHYVCDLTDTSWVIVHDDNIRFGNFSMTSAGLNHNAPGIKGPLSKLQKTKSTSSLKGNIPPETARMLALSHMENQMLLARIVKSPAEYKAWLMCYVQSLVDNDCVPRLRTLLDSLVGPPGAEDDLGDSFWEPEVLGLRKRSLVEKLLPFLGRKTLFQRMFYDYKQRLTLFETRNLFAMDST